MPPAPSKTDPARHYEAFLAMRKQILDYKWIESQKAGEDIGLERALREWTAKHRAIWRSERK